MARPASAQPPQPSHAAPSHLLLAMLFVATALWFAYEVPAIGNTGQTLGKRLMRIKVVARGEHRTARLRARVPALGPARPVDAAVELLRARPAVPAHRLRCRRCSTSRCARPARQDRPDRGGRAADRGTEPAAASTPHRTDAIREESR